MPCRPQTIAIDGPAASGKSTVGDMLAQKLGYLHFDTGVMYRAVTWAALARGVPFDNESAVVGVAEGLQIDVRPPHINDGRNYTVMADGLDVTWEIRTAAVDASVSIVAAYRGVRAALVPQQRRVAARGRVVMIGRDIATVVLPDADLKVYLDASTEARAHRRWQELLSRGVNTPFDDVLSSMARRDQIDAHRDVSPLQIAPDAILIDTTDLSVPEVVHCILELIGKGECLPA